MQKFNHVNAGSFDEACELLKKSGGRAQPLSGGTDLLGVCKDHILEDYPETVVNLKAIPGYASIEERADSYVIGAGVKLKDVAQLDGCPALAEAAHSVASPLIRSLATIGGNICQDVRCWYYRYPDSVGGAIHCKRKGGDLCYAIQGENRYHSVFGGVHIHGSACTESCPASTDISRYMEQLRAGDWQGAAWTVMERNPLPMVTSRVCPHPCQDKCNQRNYGDCVNIHAVERSVGDYILAHADEFYPAPLCETGKKIAVAGAGPGGLTAAYYLRKAGHGVTVFDRMAKAGGVLQYGIPHYRLPRKYVDEVVAALERMGVEFRLGVEVGRDVTTEQLEKAYDKVYIGTGAWKQPVLGIDGENLTEFGLDFLTEVNTYLKKAIGNDVLVCGGGNVAMDVALTAVRLGAKSVKLVCLEQACEMPASSEEVERAKEEGVQIFNGWGLARVVTDGSAVRGLEVKKCVSVFNGEHRFAPVYDESVKQVVASDYIILATGQRVDVSFLGAALAAQIKSPRGLIDVEKETNETRKSGVYAGGDAVTGPNIAIRAIAAGRNAAVNINRELGEKCSCGCAKECQKPFVTFCRETITAKKAGKLPELPVAERSLTQEDASSFTMEQAAAEAGRCMDCGCYAVSPSDLAPVLLMLNAQIVTTERTLSAVEFFTTQLCVRDLLKPGELVKQIIVPKTGAAAHYDKKRVRDAIDFAIVSLASNIEVKDGIVAGASLVLGGAAPMPCRLKEVEEFLKGRRADGQTAAEAGDLAISGVCVMGKNEYKLAYIRTTVRDAILRAAGLGGK